jgi:hypothetical protein
MSKNVKAGHLYELKEAVSNVTFSCGNCGRRIQDNQGKLQIFNSRHKAYEYYHESYLGCYDSTRESGRRVVLDRWQRGINLDTYDLDGTVQVSIGWQL